MNQPTRIEFTNRRGQRLVGMLHGEPSERMAVSCHGMLSSKDGIKHTMLAGALAERGIGTVRFDFAGRGESEGDMMELSYTSEMEDLDAAIEYLSSLGALRVGAFGSSMGGGVVLLTAARDERIAVIATLAAVAHPAEIESHYPKACAGWRDRGFIDLPGGRVGSALLEDALEHDIVAAVRVIRAPAMIVHGLADEVVPTSDAHDIASAMRNVSLELVDGADHRFSDPVHLRPTIGAIAEFIAAGLHRG
jgi:hypothetical protein